MKEFTAEIAEGAEERWPADFLDDESISLRSLGEIFGFVVFVLIRGWFSCLCALRVLCGEKVLAECSNATNDGQDVVGR